MKLLNLSILILFALHITSCITPKDGSSKSTDEKTVHKIETVDSIEGDSLTDPYTIQEVKVEGDNLIIEVCYGGCAEHDWKLVTTKRYKKSLPPQLDLLLIHDLHNDPCKKRDCTTLYFDLTDVKYPGKPTDYTVKLNIQKSNKSVNYEY
ncbi:MAG: hypothetical protein AB8B56_05025 [Crocinitomicaceae bacterium]